MSELTEKDYPTFTQMYKNLPERSSIKAPKTEFVEKVAKITKKSVKPCGVGSLEHKSRMRWRNLF